MIEELQQELRSMEEDRNEAYEALRVIVDLVVGNNYYTEWHTMAVLYPDQAIQQVRKALGK